MRKITRGAKVVFLWVVWVGLLASFAAGQYGGVANRESIPVARAQTTFSNFLYLPLINHFEPRNTPFGVETNSPLTTTSTANFVKDLELGAVRMSMRISWRELQPVEGGPIDWSQLAGVENELRVLNAADVDAVMVINDSPLWAVVRDLGDLGWCDFNGDKIVEPCSIDEYGDGGGDGKSYCGPIAEDKFDDYAAFLSQLVRRYSTPEFNVKIWELGNEPDLDPGWVPGDSSYGCWGDYEDGRYYGGLYYGRMLKAVTPAIKAADPQAQVWVGGLLLAAPYDPLKPETVSSYFLKGIYAAGSAPYSYFDAVPYHWYAWYYHTGAEMDDLDLIGNVDWDDWGGGAYGKAYYLTNTIMKPFGVYKPLMMNEVALGCSEKYEPGLCSPLPDGFLQSQANFAARTAFRALKGGAKQIHWYTLEENGWGYVGLLDFARTPKPVYYAYRNLIKQYDEGTFLGEVFYSTATEAYAVQREDGKRLHVVWARQYTTVTIEVPESELIAIYDRDGGVIAKPAVDKGVYPISVGFQPLYLILTP